MCFKLFKPAPKDGMPSMSKADVVKKLEEDILIHEYWAVKVTQEPQYAESFGDYDWNIEWIEVYKNAIFYLRQ